MERSAVKFLFKPNLVDPVLITGLPGMGYVGKLAAEHLIAELNAKKFGELHSPHFPPHAHTEPDGTLRPLRNEFYWANAGGKDMVILTGDAQATSPQGHYEVAGEILDVAKQFGVKQIFALGGYAVGEYKAEKPKVIGVVNDPGLIDKYRELGLTFESGGGPIVGASGLSLGLGRLYGIPVACLLGETHGAIADHRSAQSVLESLTNILGIEVNMEPLKDRVKEIERMISRMQHEFRRRARRERRRAEEEVWYIG